jgi:hypothetical protein
MKQRTHQKQDTKDQGDKDKTRHDTTRQGEETKRDENARPDMINEGKTRSGIKDETTPD